MTFLAEQPKQTEARFRQQVVRYAELMGWRCYWSWRSDHSPSGFPDLVLVRARPPCPRLVVVELKSDRGRCTSAQTTWLSEIHACGVETHVWRPRQWPEIEEVLR